MTRFLVLVLLVCPLSASGEDFQRLSSDAVTVLYPEALAGAARKTARIYPAIRADLERTLGWTADFRPTVVVIRETATFREWAGSEYIVAYAVSDRRVIVMDYARVNRNAESLARTLKHELCHLLLHHHIPEDRLPRWLDEGVAQWVSDGISEIFGTEGDAALTRAVLADRVIPLRRLTDRFPMDRDRLMLAYQESRSVVDYMLREHGRDAVLDILSRLRSGASVDAALTGAVGRDLDGLEAAWREDLSRHRTWLRFLAIHLYEILFVLAAAVTVVGFVRKLRRQRAYMDEDEDDDEA